MGFLSFLKILRKSDIFNSGGSVSHTPPAPPPMNLTVSTPKPAVLLLIVVVYRSTLDGRAIPFLQ